MALELFYSPGTCALSAIIALESAEMPYKLALVEREARQSEAFLSVNPWGKVPALSVDGRIVTEVSAILTHITEANPDKALVPREGPLFDQLQQWYSFFGSSFHAAFYPYFFPQRYHTDAAQHDAVREAAKIQIRKNYEHVEQHLAQHTFILGDNWSVLDGYLLAMARWGKRFLDFEKDFPHLAKHLEAEALREPVKRALAIESGERRETSSLQQHRKL